MWCTAALLAMVLAVKTAAGGVQRSASPRPPPPPLGFLSRTLGDNMVLQCAPRQAVVWGNTTAGAAVTTSFGSVTLHCKAGADGIWRQRLPATPASAAPHTLHFASSSGETARLSNVVFGQVYICSGQSNMQFSLPITTNATAEIALAAAYPHIRLFTVGQYNLSHTAWPDLGAIEQPWAVASAETVAGANAAEGVSPMGKGFNFFSSVCWFYGKQLSDELGERVPIGLISSNYENTKIEWWADIDTFARCGLKDRQSFCFNTMISPFTVGPMQLAGFAFYQGEANTFDHAHAFGPSSRTNVAYDCMFPALIENWRQAFNQSDAFFGFIQLSTWCFGGPADSPYDINAIPYMRDAQMVAAALPNVGWATNADNGDGCNIHPPAKQACAKRLANSALTVQYGKAQAWRSPTYESAVATLSSTSVTVTVKLKDVSAAGLRVDESRPYANPFNSSNGYDSLWSLCKEENVNVNCTAANQNCMCGWAAILLGNATSWSKVECCTSGGKAGCPGDPHCNLWINATVSASADGRHLVLKGALPAATARGHASLEVAATQYGFAPIPIMTVYDKGTDLPVLGWLQPLNGTSNRTRRVRTPASNDIRPMAMLIKTDDDDGDRSDTLETALPPNIVIFFADNLGYGPPQTPTL
jgi:sialate O-acetylesterase